MENGEQCELSLIRVLRHHLSRQIWSVRWVAPKVKKVSLAIQGFSTTIENTSTSVHEMHVIDCAGTHHPLNMIKVARTSCAAQPERKPKWRPFSMETATHSDSLAARSTCRRTLTSTEEPKLVKLKGLSSRSVDGQTVTSFS